MLRRTPTFEAVCALSGLAENFPIVPAQRGRPAWWRRMPLARPEFAANASGYASGTIRSCPAVGDYLRVGYVLPLWCDVIVTSTLDNVNVDASAPFNADIMPAWRSEHMPLRPGELAATLQVISPWEIRTPAGWSTLVLPPTYARETRYEVLPGVIDTDVITHLNVFIRWRATDGAPHMLTAGSPLAHLIPFRRHPRPKLQVRRDRDLHAELISAGRGGIEGQVWNRLGAFKRHRAHVLSERDA